MTADLWSVLSWLAPVWLVAAITPGPNFFAVMHVAGLRGRRAALMAALGTVAGTAVWALAGFLGLKALFAALPFAGAAIKLVSAVYLVWVAIGFWRQARLRDTGLPAAAISGGAGARAFRFGLVTNLANPKTAAFAASLFAVALPPAAPAWWAAAAIACVCSTSAGWYRVLAMVGSSAPFTAAYRRWRAGILRAAAVLFAGFGARLALEPALERMMAREAP